MFDSKYADDASQVDISDVALSVASIDMDLRQPAVFDKCYSGLPPGFVDDNFRTQDKLQMR